MKKNHPKKDSSQATDSLTPPVTRKRVQARTVELALLDGRSAHEINQHDYEQAKLELLGEPDFHKQQALLDAHGFA